MEHEEHGKHVDPQLWQACAGKKARPPPSPNSLVFYFPQGHAEHAASTGGAFDFRNFPMIRSSVPCRVAEVKLAADPETDEVFAKIRLLPLTHRTEVNPDGGNNNSENAIISSDDGKKPTSFAKILTQSDANNGGGLSVPKPCAESIFPRFDDSANRPAQTIHARDVHGGAWEFRHVYRGKPKRHLLTTGWSNFVNRKKLVAGDAVVFCRSKHGAGLGIGVIRRRASGGIGNYGVPCEGCGGGSLPFFRQRKGKMGRNNKTVGDGIFSNVGWRVKPEEVMGAAVRALSGEAFEVDYYPRASGPEFCVGASAVEAAVRVRYRKGMRVKMCLETPDSSSSSPMSWFTGTVSSVGPVDGVRWADSPWRLLEVNWDEPDILRNERRVSPWMVELLVSDTPSVEPPQFPSPAKKPRVPSQRRGESSTPTPKFSGNSNFDDAFVMVPSMQGAMHRSRDGLSSPSDRQLNDETIDSDGIVSSQLTMENSNSEQRGLRYSYGSDDEYSLQALWQDHNGEETLEVILHPKSV